jgi:hypothetical protein
MRFKSAAQRKAVMAQMQLASKVRYMPISEVNRVFKSLGTKKETATWFNNMSGAEKRDRLQGAVISAVYVSNKIKEPKDSYLRRKYNVY